ncbi:MAG: RluA family pseudouridine synthase [Flavobacteriaceae bacterium]|nr:RluA family pseudouridine synthase [Flavobacteriaceae bacterium]
MKVLETHIVPIQKTSIRIQEYAVGIFKTVATKSAIKKAIKKELIFVNDLPTTTAKMIVGGEKIALLDSDEGKTQPKLILKLAVVYEDDYLAVIYKPAGILVSGNKFKTIDNALMQNLQKSSLSDAVRPRPVHRLDYPTTGLLLIGKTSSSILALNKLFEDKEIQKTYHAIAIGKMDVEGIISLPVDEKSSESFYKVLASVPSIRFEQLNVVELTPKTGRRHQLRKHLSGIGNPILGDQDYGMKDLILKGKGLYLHASILSFIHPFTKEKLIVKSELPKRFLKIFPN